MHHPVKDPSPTGGSQLADRKEASLLSTWLTGFELASGKPAAAIASHAGVFSVSREAGVPYLINGNSGKTPAAAPGDGGFTGWTLVRFDPADRAQPVRFETRPNVDALNLTGPAELTTGANADVRAVLTQAGRQVPVSYPVSADWTCVGDPRGGRSDVARARGGGLLRPVHRGADRVAPRHRPADRDGERVSRTLVVTVR
jgi:hypothetical protein